MQLLEARAVTKVFGGRLLAKGHSTVAVDEVSLAINEDKPTITAIAGKVVVARRPWRGCFWA